MIRKTSTSRIQSAFFIPTQPISVIPTFKPLLKKNNHLLSLFKLLVTENANNEMIPTLTFLVTPRSFPC